MKRKYMVNFSSFLISFFLMLSILMLTKYAPFGNKSLAGMDANIQYLDFFAYYKDLLARKTGIFSMSYLLGGDNTTTLAYYLASPLNLIILFFKKNQLNTFYSFLYIIKVSLASFTITFFLQQRFPKIKSFYVVILAISYAFIQYDLAQASNIIWLDGVYLLPILLLGIYKIIDDPKSLLGKFLIIGGVGCSLIFNWYTGIINCLFSVFYFLFELGLYYEREKGFVLKDISKRILVYAYSSVIGCMLSAFLFLPNVYMLIHGSRNSTDWSLFNTRFINNPLEFIGHLSIGATSTINNVSLYCGPLTIVGLFSYFFLRNRKKDQKFIIFLGIIFIALLYYWQPLYFLFSMFKSVESYWSRYGYLGSFFIIFVTALFLNEYRESNSKDSIIYGTVLFSTVFLIFNWNNLSKIVILSLCLTIITAISVIAYEACHNKLSIILLTLCVCLGLGLNASKLFAKYSVGTNVASFKKYESSQDKQINFIKKKDKSNYRISQTSTRNMLKNNLTANYNESLAFNYWSIASYTSNESVDQLDLLNNLGYRNELGRAVVVNTSILGSDSLLGVKYLLSKYPISGYKRMDVGKVNGKYIFINKYALPIAYISKKRIIPKFNANTFEYQNSIYSEIYGKRIEIYKPVSYTVQRRGKYILDTHMIKDTNFPVYGNLIWNMSTPDGSLYINNKFKSGYATWLSPSVFDIPVNKNTTDVSFKAKQIPNLQPQFYYLNTNMLEKVNNSVKKDSVKPLFKGNRIFIHIGKTNKNSYLNITVPYSEGWSVYRNDKKIKVQKFMNCFMTIRLKPGVNNIEFKYNTPMKKEGIIISVLGILLSSMIIFFHIDKV
ncbi:YfhO family protein [Limosilactobacillus mucosae]|uniref:YfhO family protein n=1 Tax=Limosilactobacillus mucosae TaxID=97478 RepID=UPI00399478F7